MTWQSKEPPKRRDPLRPAIGFLLLLVVGGFSILIAPAGVNWLETTHLTVGAWGWQILPIVFPPWPALVKQGIVALLVFVIAFTVLMVVMLAVMKPPMGEADVSLHEVRARKGTRRRRR